MSQEEEKTQAFFESLAGRSSGENTPVSPGVEQLRKVLRDQLETLREAERADAIEWGAVEKSRMDTLKQRLVEEGVLGKPAASVKATESSWLSRLRDWLLGTGWERPLAMAVTFVFGLFIVLQLALPPAPDYTVVRGTGGDSILKSRDPLKLASELSNQLEEAGAEVLVVQVNDQEWSLRIDLPQPEKEQVIKKLLSDKGIRTQAYPPYRLTIRKVQ